MLLGITASWQTISPFGVISFLWILRLQFFQRKGVFALSAGCVPSPTARLVLLGDAGVGKTSTCRHLLGKPHPKSHHPTEVVESAMAEWTQVDAEWRQMEPGVNERGSVLDQALATFCLFRKSDLYPDKQWNRWWKRLDVIFGVLKIAFVVLVLLRIFEVPILENEQATGLGIQDCVFVDLVASLHVFLSLSEFWVQVVHISFWILVFLTSYFQMLISFFQCLVEDPLHLSFLFAVGVFVGFVFQKLLCSMPRTFAILWLTFSIMLQSSHIGLNNTRVLICISAVINFLQCLEHRRADSFTDKVHTFPQVMAASFVFLLLLRTFSVKHDIVRFLPFGLGFAVTFLCRSKVEQYVQHERRNRKGREVFMDAAVSYVIVEATFPLLSLIPSRRVVFLYPLIFLLLYGELFFWAVNKGKDLAMSKVHNVLATATGSWPAKLSILDCGGQPIYHAAHHIFMTAHSTFLLVFRLTDLCEDFEAAEGRIRLWLASVSAHAQHPDSRVFLVATHARSVSRQRREEALARLKSAVMRKYCGRLARSEIVAIDNAQRKQSEEAVSTLRRLIWDVATRAEFAVNPSRVSWFHLVDHIQRQRSRVGPPLPETESQGPPLIVSRRDLWEQIEKPCRLSNESEFFRMLRFFVNRGDIFTDLRACDMDGSVLLDPTLLERAVRILVPLAEEQRTAFWSRQQLDSALSSLGEDMDCLLAMLEVHGLVLRWGEESSFLVPLNLKERRSHEYPLIDRPAAIFRFDFKGFDPQPIFLRLLSKLPVDRRLLLVHKNCAKFQQHEGAAFSLEISDFKLCFRSQTKAPAMRVVYMLQSFLQRVCRRHFEFAIFHFQAPCECSHAALLAGTLDQAAADFVTVIEFRQWPASPLQRRYPLKRLSYPCTRDRQRLSSFDGAKVSNEDRKVVDQEMSSVPGLEEPPVVASDVFVSCAPEDRQFLFDELIPVLETPSCLSDQNTGIQEQGLSVSAVFRDDASPGMWQLWSSAERRAANLERSRVVLAVVSPTSKNDRECQQERIKALTIGKPVVAVFLDVRSPPPELLHVRGLRRPQLTGSALVKKFYVPLQKSVLSAVEGERGVSERIARYFRDFRNGFTRACN